MNVQFFETQDQFRNWLEANHLREKELLVGYYKVKSGKASMTWSQSVDQALCFGWIDGIRRSIDEESYCIRFTPRSPKSIWSAVNIKKVEELTRQGLMKEEGIKAFRLLSENNSRVYSHENAAPQWDPVLEAQFKLHPSAWDFFQKQSPSYKKVILHWIHNAKREITRQTRLQKTIDFSSRNLRLDTYQPGKDK